MDFSEIVDKIMYVLLALILLGVTVIVVVLAACFIKMAF